LCILSYDTGFACESYERLSFSEFLPNDALAVHPFDTGSSPLIYSGNPGVNGVCHGGAHGGVNTTGDRGGGGGRAHSLALPGDAHQPHPEDRGVCLCTVVCSLSSLHFVVCS
jgi:hypothetical protein